MKDNRKTPFVARPGEEIGGTSGRKKFGFSTYLRFSEFLYTDSNTGTHLRDFTRGKNPCKIVLGQADAGGSFSDTTGTLTDLNMYGSTVYTPFEILEDVKTVQPLRQSGIKLPISGQSDAGVATSRKFVARTNSADMNPSDYATNPNGLTFMIKGTLGANTNNQPLLMIGCPKTQASAFSIEYTNSKQITIKHRDTSADADAAEKVVTVPTTTGCFTLFVHADVDVGVLRPRIGVTALYNTATGDLINSDTSIENGSSSAIVALKKPTLYIGYGQSNGGVNADFTLTDFLTGPIVAEVVTFNGGLSLEDMSYIASSHTAGNHHKSGFNNRNPRKVQQLLDAQSSYPASSNPLSLPTPTVAFNDTTTKIFGKAPNTIEQQAYPEVVKWDGSNIDTTAWIKDTINDGVNSTSVVNVNWEPKGPGVIGRAALQFKGGDSNSHPKSATGLFVKTVDKLPPGTYNLSFYAANNKHFENFESTDKVVVSVYQGEAPTNSAETPSHKTPMTLYLSGGYRSTGESHARFGVRDITDTSASKDQYFFKSDSFTISESDANNTTVQIWRQGSGTFERVYLWDIKINKSGPGMLMFPEMLPASMFSGSDMSSRDGGYKRSNPTDDTSYSSDNNAFTVGIGAPGDTRKFYRDVHNTPFKDRLVAPGFVRSGLSHKETELLNLSSRNSPITLSKDTEILGGNITPFDDSNPQIDMVSTRAVSEGVYPGLQQRLGDHVAIVIDLNPSAETTIGVERDGSGLATGRITSMAYYNFQTNKWETQGKNNDFVVPPAVTIGTASLGAGIPANQVAVEHIVSQLPEKLFNSASVGFVGTSGFTLQIPKENYTISHNKDAVTDQTFASLSSRALPTSNYGFPIANKYEAKSGQLIDMSKYIDSPFLLERVSFEYGAAIEESGPHSLGYTRRDIDGTAGVSNEGLTLSNATQPQMIAKTRGTPPSDDPLRSFNYNRSTSINRGEFINGSLIYNLTASSSPDGGFNDVTAFYSSSAKPLRRLMHAAWNDRTDGRIPELFISSSARNVSSQMFLKTANGPRLNISASRPAFQPNTQALNKNSKPVSYIPVLAGGVNGIVTGSEEIIANNRGGPFVSLEANRDYPGLPGNDMSSFENYSSGLDPQGGGTPFWRADTFFLMRQSNKPSNKAYGVTIHVRAGCDTVFFPVAPYSGFSTGRNGSSGWQVEEGATVNNMNVESPSTGLGKANAANYGKRDLASFGVRVPDAPGTALNISSLSSTSREIITFGQMVHYGYANAATSFYDSVVDPVQSVHPLCSGSINVTSREQLMIGDATKTRRPVPLFGQAIKYANYPDYAFSAIPCNIEDPGHPGGSDRIPESDISSFSDYPDSHQGQWAGSLHLDSITETGFSGGNQIMRLPPVRLKASAMVPDQTAGARSGGGIRAKIQNATISSLNERNKRGSARYALSGAAPSYSNWSTPTADAAANRPETTHTLDTISYPAAALDHGYYNPEQTQVAATQGKYRGILALSGARNAPEESAYQQYARMPLGSGFSIISTPAFIANEGKEWPDKPNALRNDFHAFGTFNRPSQALLDKGQSALSWLDHGLGRDLNVEVKQNMRHQGTNPDIADNFCGFTLMTASTVSRPGVLNVGRESAALPLVANVYKRQYLNYNKSFKMTVPVRATVPSPFEPQGFWTFTSPPFKKDAQTQGDMPSYHDPNEMVWDGADSGPINTTWAAPSPGTYEARTAAALDPLSNFESGIAHQRAYSAKRFHRRWAVTINDGGWVPGISVSGFNSGRMFTSRVTAATPVTASSQTPIPFGVGSFYSAKGFEDTRYTGTFDSFAWGNAISKIDLAGLFAKDSAKESLYVLDPKDKLILGVQPSLPGWNLGSGLPNNRASMKWGVWDYKESFAQGFAVSLDYARTNGAVLDSAVMNLEDPYEPAHGLTMLQTPSRVILYGTFMRNDKHFSPSSKQELRSNSVHEALHYDNPVLDQYLVSSQDEYVGTYLDEHITKPTLQEGRGAYLSAGAGTLTFSGSFQRFRKVSETSQVFYDTLLQNPVSIARATGVVKLQQQGSKLLAGNSLINFYQPHPEMPQMVANLIDLYSDFDILRYDYLQDAEWMHSFPFESKYKGVERLTTRDPSFMPQGTGSIYLGMATPMPITSSNVPVYPPPFGFTSFDLNVPASGAGRKTALSFLSGGVGGDNPLAPIGRQYWKDIIDRWGYNLSNGKYMAVYGAHLAGIRNMADVSMEIGDLTSDNTNSGGNTTQLMDGKGGLAEYRTLGAYMVGYGRTNRKQLDISSDRFQLRYEGTIPFTGVTGAPPTVIASTSGKVIAFHPAGFKYGYMNSDHLSPSMVYRADRYGNFRDALEQRLYSRVYSYGDEYKKKGLQEAAVSCIFVDAAGAPISDATNTQCLNLSTAMTSSKPFIEGEVAREIIINFESVTID